MHSPAHPGSCTAAGLGAAVSPSTSASTLHSSTMTKLDGPKFTTLSGNPISFSGVPLSPFGALSASWRLPSISATPLPSPKALSPVSPPRSILPSAATGDNVPVVLAVDHTLATSFLEKHRDKFGRIQSGVWLLDQLGRTRIQTGEMLCHMLALGTECYALVGDFIIRSKTQALFGIKLLGWRTPGGWFGLEKDIYAFLLCPLHRCAPVYFTRPYAYDIYPFDLQMQVLNAAKYLPMWLRGDAVNLPAGDRVTGYILDSHIKTPVLSDFETEIGGMLTVVAKDLDMRLNSAVIPPPPSFHPRSLKACPGAPPYAVYY